MTRVQQSSVNLLEQRLALFAGAALCRLHAPRRIGYDRVKPRSSASSTSLSRLGNEAMVRREEPIEAAAIALHECTQIR